MKLDDLIWNGYDVSEEIVSEIERLLSLTSGELREYYKNVWGYDIRSINRNFLISKSAWKIQANLFGDISDAAHKHAYLLADFKRLKIRSHTKVRHKDKRIPMPGCVLTRVYKGKLYKVHILDGEFECDGKRFKSLSAIARHITGTNWNGFTFFSLNKKSQCLR